MFHNDKHRLAVIELRRHNSAIFRKRCYADIGVATLSTAFFLKNASSIIAGQSYTSSETSLALGFTACAAGCVYVAFKDLSMSVKHSKGHFDETYDWRKVDMEGVFSFQENK